MTPVKREPPKGRVITFYSYKGGTGRSMAMANVAWILALSGQRVLVIDWDLEAPGIHRYFHPLLEDKELRSTEGLLDFVEKLETRAAIAPEPLPERDVDVVEYITMLNWPSSSTLTWKQFGPRAGIDLLPAGQQGPGYSAKLAKFNWIEFYGKLGGRRLLRIAREQLRGIYDYVLIDSRTGVSDTSGICTVEAPDTLVVCFTLNDQSIKGASGVAQSVVDQRGAQAEGAPGSPRQPPLRIFPIPTRVEILSEKDKREVALALARRQFAPFVEGDAERYWGAIQLPYYPFYAFEEIPAIFGDVPAEQQSLSTPLKQIAREITADFSLDVPRLHTDPVEAERLRKEVVGWYLRKSEVTKLDPISLTQKVYSEFDRTSQLLMRRVLLRLVQVSANAPPSPSTCPFEELDPSLTSTATALLDHGILTGSGSRASIYIADPKLIETWDPLKQWIAEDSAFLSWRQSLTAAARRWRETEHDASALLRGRLLGEAVKWQEQRAVDLTPDENDFISRSVAAEQTPAKKQYSWSFKGTMAASILGFLLAGGGLWFSKDRTKTAERGAAILALGGKYADTDPLLAALLIAEIGDYTPQPKEKETGIRVAGAAIPERVLQSKGAVRSVEFSRDGKLLAVAGDSGTEIWSTEGWIRLRTVGGKSISASFNGWVPERAKSRGASGQVDRLVTTRADGVIQVWSLEGHELLTPSFDGRNPGSGYFEKCTNRLVQKLAPPPERKSLVNPVYARFSPDEAVIIVAYDLGPLLMLDPKNGKCFDIYSPPSRSRALFSPDGEWAVTEGLTYFHVQDWKQDERSLPIPGQLAALSNGRQTLLLSSEKMPFASREITALPGDVGALSFDGSAAAAANAATGAAQWQRWPDGVIVPLLGQAPPITAVSFDPSGAWILTASQDATIRIWPTARRPELSPLASWNDIVSYLRNSTKACLTAQQRSFLLNEKADEAQTKAANCEAQFSSNKKS